MDDWKWERLESSDDSRTERMHVVGGWIVRTIITRSSKLGNRQPYAVKMIFVPDLRK